MSRKSSVILNTREQVLSADVNRLQQLSAREWMDTIRDFGRGDPYRTQGSNNTIGLAFSGDPVNRLQLKPTYAPSGINMTATVGAGELHVQTTAPSADDSAYQVLRWLSTVLTFGAGDATNPRIDLVVVTNGDQSTDLSSRTILVDPVARTTAPATVNKTRNPLATLSVIAGTPAATPGPPSIPAGTFLLMQVDVPATITIASNAHAAFVPALHSASVGDSMHGILEGFSNLILAADADDSSDDFQATFLLDGIYRVIIDGELITFKGGYEASVQPRMVLQDASNNPLTGAASATADTPFYYYVVGGRHAPNQRGGRGNQALNQYYPVNIIESLTPPAPDGRPTAPISYPIAGGTTTTREGALYVGVGFITAGSGGPPPRRKDVQWVDDMVIACDGITGGTAFFAAAFNEAGLNGAPAATALNLSVLLASKPNLATWYRGIVFTAALTAGPHLIRIHQSSAAGASRRAVFQRYVGTGAGYDRAITHQYFESAIATGAAKDYNVRSVSLETDFDAIYIRPVAYNMRVKRYGR